jgi:hypothetical protein
MLFCPHVTGPKAMKLQRYSPISDDTPNMREDSAGGKYYWAEDVDKLAAELAQRRNDVCALQLENDALRGVLFAPTVQDMIQGCDCERCHPLREQYEDLRSAPPQECKHE